MVSAIIPNFNHGRFLKQRIDSVLNQSYADIEVIILDDCSTDDSRDIIEPYRLHPKVSHIVYNDTNSGSPFLQWKKGIALAAGEYIWIAESDDYCELSLLQTLVDGILNNNHCVLAYAQSVVLNDDGHINRVTTHPLIEEYIPGGQYIVDYLAENCSICNAGMAIFKKESYQSVSPDFASYRLCGDWAFWTEIARQGNVFISAKVLNYFRQYSAGVSGRIFSTGSSFVEEIRLLYCAKAILFGRGQTKR
jgi:glycosyltransferase involved in cell wall biosynthesis